MQMQDEADWLMRKHDHVKLQQSASSAAAQFSVPAGTGLCCYHGEPCIRSEHCLLPLPADKFAVVPDMVKCFERLTALQGSCTVPQPLCRRHYVPVFWEPPAYPKVRNRAWGFSTPLRAHDLAVLKPAHLQPPSGATPSLASV